MRPNAGKRRKSANRDPLLGKPVTEGANGGTNGVHLTYKEHRKIGERKKEGEGAKPHNLHNLGVIELAIGENSRLIRIGKRKEKRNGKKKTPRKRDRGIDLARSQSTQSLTIPPS